MIGESVNIVNVITEFQLFQDFNLPEMREDLKKPVANIVNNAIEKIRERFENNPSFQGNLYYHNSRHTILVIKNAIQIIEAIRKTNPSILTDKDVALIIITAAGHDLVQEWQEETLESLTGTPIKKNGLPEKMKKKALRK